MEGVDEGPPLIDQNELDLELKQAGIQQIG